MRRHRTQAMPIISGFIACLLMAHAVMWSTHIHVVQISSATGADAASAVVAFEPADDNAPVSADAADGATDADGDDASCGHTSCHLLGLVADTDPGSPMTVGGMRNGSLLAYHSVPLEPLTEPPIA